MSFKNLKEDETIKEKMYHTPLGSTQGAENAYIIVMPQAQIIAHIQPTEPLPSMPIIHW